jgi:short-subunit dehydrogenase
MENISSRRRKMNDKKNIALVTGASSGIGEAISRELVKRGWLVIGIARSRDKLIQIEKDLLDGFIPMVCDVSKKEQIEEASQQILKRNLCPSLFFLNAGISGETAVENPNRLDVEKHEKIMRVNYFGVLLWVEFWEKLCIKNGGANFIATSSVNAIFAPPCGSGYAASKAAIAKAFEGLSLTYFSTPLKFSVVYPGPVATSGLYGKVPFTWKSEKMARYMVDCACKGKAHCEPSWFYAIFSRLLHAMPYRWTNSILKRLSRS